jgi:hypothetical protein
MGGRGIRALALDAHDKDIAIETSHAPRAPNVLESPPVRQEIARHTEGFRRQGSARQILQFHGDGCAFRRSDNDGLPIESNLPVKGVSIQGAHHSVLCGQMRDAPKQEDAGEECPPRTWPHRGLMMRTLHVAVPLDRGDPVKIRVVVFAIDSVTLFRYHAPRKADV